ncbi:MAG TPA: HNH endonuclease [bacterium]|nr:HNH endonuclease [bacterium]
MAETANCIYCGRTFDPSKGEGDHVIPAAWGEFRNDIRFRGLCQECNRRIGKAEQHMLQCGPERIFREMVVPASSRSRGKRASWVGADGLPPPQSVAHAEEGVLKVRFLDNPGKVSAPDQFVIYDEAGVAYPIELFPGISPNALRNKRKRIQVKVIKEARLHCDESRWDDYMKTIKKVWKWPENKQVELPRTEPGMRTILIDTMSRFKILYFQAIAKIAFHYYLATSGRFKGYEPCFSEIRDFIMNGTAQGKDKIFIRRPTSQKYIDLRWFHVLAAKERNGVATGHVCLFRGPQYRGSEYVVILGKFSDIIMPLIQWAHSYEYDDPVPSKGKVGIVRPVQVTRMSVY